MDNLQYHNPHLNHLQPKLESQLVNVLVCDDAKLAVAVLYQVRHIHRGLQPKLQAMDSFRPINCGLCRLDCQVEIT